MIPLDEAATNEVQLQNTTDVSDANVRDDIDEQKNMKKKKTTRTNKQKKTQKKSQKKKEKNK